MLSKRFVTALWGIPLLAAAVWFEVPLPWFTVLIALWGALAAIEFYRLAGLGRSYPALAFGTVLVVLFIISRDSRFTDALEPGVNTALLLPVLLTASIVLPLVWLISRRKKEETVSTWVWTAAGILYIGWMLSFLVSLRGLAGGRNWVLLVFFATFASDSAAYFIGRAFGRHKLAPHISPAKTWQGAAAGLIGAVVISLVFTLDTFFAVPLSWWQAVILGGLISVFGQLGDLAESLFKRHFDVKDSGSRVPGHGGFLDRLDSLLFAGVVVYYFVVFAL